MMKPHFKYLLCKPSVRVHDTVTHGNSKRTLVAYYQLKTHKTLYLELLHL